MTKKAQRKQQFLTHLQNFVASLNSYVSTDDGQWTIKGFIDIYKNIYTISSDTKIVSKILELHLFPHILEFAEQHGYYIVLPEHQNYYPDLSFIDAHDPSIKFAVDLKTTYRLPESSEFCNGFTLGSHGEYFIQRSSRKNIHFPYSEYFGHYCLGIIYSRAAVHHLDDTTAYTLDHLRSIVSVIRDFQFFAVEKWQIASDKSGSGNTANIGSIKYIPDLLTGNGMFAQLGEAWFDDYWMNYGVITMTDPKGNTRKITTLEDFVIYRGGNPQQILHKPKKPTRKKRTIPS